ncbi:MAG: carbohydrate binding family 9 domain-containing protein [Candidatus Aminicenantales bacterium]
MKKCFFLALLLSLILACPGFAAEVQAVRVEKGPKIDGLLSDPAWQSTVPFTDFRMVEPRANSDPSEQTELRVLYDEANLYLGLLCLDSEPGRIAANTMAHDNAGGSGGGGWGGGGGHHGPQGSSDDLVRVLLDSFQNKRHAYIFYVNPLGARSEGLAYGGNASLDWDGIWEAKSRLLDNGWSAEIRIPFKTISFKPGLSAWGINVERVIPRKLETIRLAGTNRDSNFNNPMEAAVLTGIEKIRQGMGITFRPYGLASSRTGPPGTGGRSNSLDGGFDIYKNFTPNLVGVLSYNMDFAETEADERRINLTRFPLFFPEKRMFFLEGSDTFSFSSSISFVPFFSRRIGLFEGEQIPVRLGAKLYGKIGETNISALDVQTGDYPGLPGSNLFAARLTQNIFAESKVGWIFTNGSPAGGRNTLAGIDFNYSTSQFAGNKNLMLVAWAAYNWNEQTEGRHHGFGFRANYPNDLWNVETTYAYYGEALDPGLGYMMRLGMQTFYVRLAYQPRPGQEFLGGLVRQFFFQSSFDYYWDLSGNLETRHISLTPLSLQTESGDRFEFEVEPYRDVLPYDFEVASGVVLPLGSYDFTNIRFSVNTANHRPVLLEASYRLGQFYSGHLDEATVGLTAKLDGYLNLSFNADLVRGRLPQGNFNENVFQVKADFFLSPDLGLMNYIQYDDISRELGWSARLRWQISPGNEIYLVYNKNWERRSDPASRFAPLEDRGVLKISLSIRP